MTAALLSLLQKGEVNDASTKRSEWMWVIKIVWKRLFLGPRKGEPNETTDSTHTDC
jgi:hypothetical protein